MSVWVGYGFKITGPDPLPIPAVKAVEDLTDAEALTEFLALSLTENLYEAIRLALYRLRSE